MNLDLPRVINGVGPATRLGGLPMHEEVWAAMRAATRYPARIDLMQTQAGRELATLLGVPGAYVTSGASAALTLATAAALAGDDPRLIDDLPVVRSARHEVVVQLGHRDPYDHAVTAAGARLVTVGYPASTHPDELARALGPTAAAVLWRPGRPGDLLSLARTAQIAHEHGVPVIVDGALFVPPIDRLSGFFADGADLVAVSGGKGFRGPQASGLLCGRSAFLSAVPLHHQDMDERPATWLRGEPPETPPAGDQQSHQHHSERQHGGHQHSGHQHSGQPGERRHGGQPDELSATWPGGGLWRAASSPRHGIGRGMKVGREQIAGLLAAVTRYVRDPGADDRPGIAELDEIAGALAGAPALSVTRAFDDALNVPILHIAVDTRGDRTDEVIRQLRDGTPAVAVGEELAWRGMLSINPMALLPGDGISLAHRLLEVTANGHP